MKNKEQKVNDILNRGVIVDILPDKEAFKKRLLDSEPMKIFIGVDPTSDSLHLSHAKNFMLLEDFRKLGNEVVLVFGDFTARIGDPSGKESSRDQLSAEQTEKNAKSWLEQIKPLMDFDNEENPPEIVFNSEWLSNLNLEDVIDLASNFTVQQMLDRDMFEKRLESGNPIHLHEFMYPLMQGFDSVALEADAEIGGTDQTFNTLAGRKLVKKFHDKEKFVVTVNLMENPKTGELMSKSQDTGVFIDSKPFDMFGSIMAQPDEMTKVILVNNTRIPLKEVESIIENKHPRDAKMRAAFEVVRIFHGEQKAKEAKEKFINLVQKDQSVEDLPEVAIEDGQPTVFELVRACLDEDTSNSQIRRLIKQRAVKVDGEVFDDFRESVKLPDDGATLKVGKKRWFEVFPE